jgi:hypothetical protein
MDDLLNNRFVQCLGVGALFYLLLQLLALSINSVLKILESFAYWYRMHAMPHAGFIAIMAGIAYLLVFGVFSSRRS